MATHLHLIYFYNYALFLEALGDIFSSEWLGIVNRSQNFNSNGVVI